MRNILKQVEEYLNYCEKVRGMSPATMNMKRNTLKRFVEAVEIDRIENLTNEVFNRWVMHEVEQGVSARSVNTYNSTIFAMVQYHREMGASVPLRISLVKKLKEGQARRNFYTAEEVEEVLRFAGVEAGLMIKIMFETGMRIAELTRLRTKDIEGRRIRFLGKGRKMREVYIKERTREELSRYMIDYGVVDYVWGANGGESDEPPTVATIRKRLRQPFYAAGFDDFYPHALRHSFATDLQRKGASVAEIKEMIGHESVATTERYLHGFEGRLEELFDKYR